MVPAELGVCLGRIADQEFNFRRAEIAGIDLDHHIRP